ncbi:MAG: hypothetical protein NTW19_23045 [Planctomycetota bacterium]|nr:hypothetical protein [Planctomycetota bacterium]
MTSLTLAQAPELFAAAFGAIAALLLIGGPVILAWQRNRQQYDLMRAAMERGITRFAEGPPLWLVSLRQGLLITTLGVGLLIVGGGAWGLASWVPMPTTTGGHLGPGQGKPQGPQENKKPNEPGKAGPEHESDEMQPPPRPPEGMDGERPPRPGEDRGPGFGPPGGPGGPGDFDGPPGRPRGPMGEIGRPGRPGGPMGAMLPPPPPNPAWERWHRAQAQLVIGQVAVACGVILTLLGVVRTAFARAERRILDGIANSSNGP